MRDFISSVRTACRIAFIASLSIGSWALGEEPQTVDLSKRAKEDVRILTTGVFDETIEFDDVWSRMHSAMQEGIGGREKAESGFKKGKTGAGVKVLSIEFAKEPEFFETDARKYVVVEAELVLASETLAEKKTITWIGSLENEGNDWKYVDASGAKSEDLRAKVFDDFPEGRKFAGGFSLRGPREKVLTGEEANAP